MRKTVEETPDALLDEKASELVGPGATRGRRAGRPTAAATTRGGSSRVPGNVEQSVQKFHGAAARTVRDGFSETLSYTEFPPEHWLRIGTNNGIVRINREIGRRTRVVGTFPDGNSALRLVTARLKCIVEHKWGEKRYLDMSKLEEMDELKEKAAGYKRTGPRTAKSICERISSVPFRPRRSSLYCCFF